jgi:transposase InsO family protein
MCERAGVSTSGYYEWRDRPASATAIRRGHLKKLVTAIFELSDETYGYRRVHAQLLRQGKQVSAELVRELMRELGLVSCQPRPYRPSTTTPSDPGPIDALRMAARNYPLTQGAMFHSDRGTQYTSVAFAAATDFLGIRRSVGATGVCFDNSLTESFNAPSKSNGSTALFILPWNKPGRMLPGTLNSATILNAFTQGSDIRPRMRFTPST